MYIIKDSNNRYFAGWIDSTPVFNGDALSAKLLNEADTDKTIRTLRMIVKGIYEKILCDAEFIKKKNRDNPEWYRQQIEALVNEYEKKSAGEYDEGSYLIFEQVIDDLEKIL